MMSFDFTFFSDLYFIVVVVVGLPFFCAEVFDATSSYLDIVMSVNTSANAFV